MEVEQRRVDGVDRLVVERLERDQMQVSEESRGERAPARARRHRAEQQRVEYARALDRAAERVQRALVEQLPEELERRLRAERVLLRHVQVVQEERQPLSPRR